MSQHGFSLTAGIVFLLIALAHLARIVFGVPFVVQSIAVPMWASLVAVVIAGYLAYEGFHFARKVGPKVWRCGQSAAFSIGWNGFRHFQQ